MIRVVSVALCLALLAGAGCGKHKYGQYDLDSSLSRYLIELRWGRFMKAAEHVTPEMRGAFVQVWTQASQQLEVQDLDVRNLLVAEDGNSAQVTLGLTYVDRANMSVKTAVVDQVWKRTDYGWLASDVFDPTGRAVPVRDKDGEPKGAPSDPGFGGQ